MCHARSDDLPALLLAPATENAELRLALRSCRTSETRGAPRLSGCKPVSHLWADPRQVELSLQHRRLFPPSARGVRDTAREAMFSPSIGSAPTAMVRPH